VAEIVNNVLLEVGVGVITVESDNDRKD